MSVLYRLPGSVTTTPLSIVEGQITNPVTITITRTVCKYVYTHVTIIFTDGRASIEMSEAESEPIADPNEDESWTDSTLLQAALEIVENPEAYLLLSGLPLDWTGIVDSGPVERTKVCTEVPETVAVGGDGGSSSTNPAMATGWDAGARTVGSLSGDGRFSFKLSPDTLGVVCGLCVPTDSVDPFQIHYAFTGVQGNYQARFATGHYSANTIFTIQRIGNEIQWLVDYVVVDTLTNGLTGALQGRASIYASGDAVFDAEFIVGLPDEANEVGGENILPSLRATGSGAISFKIDGGATTRLPMLKSIGAQSGFRGGGIAYLPSLTALGWIYPITIKGSVILPSLNARGTVGSAGLIAGVAALPKLVGYGIVGVENAISGQVHLPGLEAQGKGIVGPKLAISGQARLMPLTGIGRVLIQWRLHGRVVLPNLTSTGRGHDQFGGETNLLALFAYGQVGVNGYGLATLPKLTAYGHNLASPILIGGYVNFRVSAKGFARESLRFGGENELPKLRAIGSDVARIDGHIRLPALRAIGKLIYAEGSANLKVPVFGCRAVAIEGLCKEPYRNTIMDGLKGTWLSEAEKRIETHYGILGKGTNAMELQLQYGNPYGDGVLEYIFTQYQGNTAIRHTLGVEMLAFVPPNRLSTYSIDRVFAHELVHAVLNDYIHQSQLPTWFHEGCAELIHGAAHRLRSVISYTSTYDLMKLIDPWAGTSPAYAAAYVSVLWLHELSGGIEQILARILNGQTLNAAIAAETSYTSLTAFVTAAKGTPGRLYLEQVLSRGFGLSPDTGAIGGQLVSNGPMLDDESVISDTLT